MMGLSSSFIEALGLSLLDSLWQGAVILLICTLLLALFRSGAARWRYRLVLLSLLALPVAGIITFYQHYEPASPMMEESQVLPVTITSEIAPFELEVTSEAPHMLERWQLWAQQNANWAVTAWVIGLMIFALRMAGGFYMLRSLKASTVPLSQALWQTRLTELSTSLGMKLKVQLKESARVSSPIVIGYLKPIIIFPLGLVQGISTDQVEAILLHELAHIKRHDYLVNLLVSLLQVVYFYHPAYWWLQQQLDAEREYSCDDLVIAHVNQLSLVKALTAVREYQMNQYMPTLGFAGHKNQLLKRVERIMKKKTRTNWLGGLLSVSLLLLSFFLMSYQSVEPTEEPEDGRIITTAVPFLTMAPIDSITFEQAVMQLIDHKENNIMLELDGQGRLVGMMRNGEAVSEPELKIFQQAHAKIRNYQYREEKAVDEEVLVEQIKRLRELEVYYKQKSDSISAHARSENERMRAEAWRQNALLKKKEIEVIEIKVQEYELMLKELKEKLAQVEGKKLGVSNDLDELLKYHSKLIRDYKAGKYKKFDIADSIIFTMYPNNGSKLQEYYRFKIAISQLEERLKYMEENNLVLVEEIKQRPTSQQKYEEELRALELKLAKRKPLAPAKYDYTDSDLAQRMAASHLSSSLKSLDELLIVVDGEIKENWTIADLDKLNKSLAIKTVEIIRANKMTEEKYKQWVGSKDAFLIVTTQPGKKDFERPSIKHAPPLYKEMSEAEIHQRFSKLLLEKLMVDGLITKEWKTVSLSRKELLIDEKKQSKKMHKKYLQYYEDIANEALEKGKTIELKN